MNTRQDRTLAIIDNLHYKYAKGKAFTDIAYITVEDNSNMERIDCVADDLIESDGHTQLTIIEKCEEYFVVKIEYDYWDEVKDICSSITYLLLQYGIGSFTIDCKAEELKNEYD